MTAPAPGARTSRLLVALFTTTLFANALLLFVVEPMFTKMVLPLLGGTPSVWNTCLLFFQAALLAGYLYAHLVARWLPRGAQAALHVALVALAFTTLPIAVASSWRPPVGMPTGWLVLLLTVSIGAPFFVLSAGAPLLQGWFAKTGHPDSRNPYFLYAASNLGSMVALLAYPMIIEPSLPLASQSRAWSWGYAALALMLALCGLAVARAAVAVSADAQAPTTVARAHDAFSAARVRSSAWLERLRWVLLSFAPSSLLLGVTSYLSTDVAAIPLLWVVPLALYLLSFVLVFARRPPLPHVAMLWLQGLMLTPLIILMMWEVNRPLWLFFPLHLAAFFLTAMVCHGELSASRPEASRLTEFYLWMSVGGVLGGVFNVLVAPTLFQTLIEYPAALMLAAALRPRGNFSPDTVESEERAAYDASSAAPRWLHRWPLLANARTLDYLLPVALCAFTWAVTNPDIVHPTWGKYLRPALCGVAGLLCFSYRSRPARFALGLAAVYLGGSMGRSVGERRTLYRARSFFGAYQVQYWENTTVLMHGTTLHGAQDRRAEFRREPLTYYHREGPLGQLFGALFRDVPNRRVAVVGLGTGTIACHGRANEHWSFYEIDPLVLRIATTPRFFTYLRDCPPRVRVVLGDARLRLAEAPPASYDLILLDAFSSDAIPTHLLTREALAMYASKLAPGGVIGFHISNRFVDLEPVLARLAIEGRFDAILGADRKLTKAQGEMLKTTSEWVVLSRSAQTLAPLARMRGWRRIETRPGVRAWTDDFSDVLSVFTFR